MGTARFDPSGSSSVAVSAALGAGMCHTSPVLNDEM
jgi:hypothetical protein